MKELPQIVRPQSRAGKEHLKKLSGTSDQEAPDNFISYLRSLSGGSPISSKQSPPYLGTPGAGIPRLLPCFSSPNGTRCAGLPFGAACGGSLQLKNGHEGFGGQLDGAQGTHFLLACSPANKFAGGPKWIQMLGRSEFALRQGFACGKTLVRRKGAAGQKAG